MSALRALSSTELADPPSDIETTAGRSVGSLATACATQLMPAATPDVLPLPLLLSTFTACSTTLLCTPVLTPPAVPLQWVPWP